VKKLIIASGGCLLGLLAAEVTLHIALPSLDFHFPIPRLTDDRFTDRANRASDGNGVHYAFDADGFRSTGNGSATADRSILFIGDSFTQGFGVSDSETFPAVTCQQLRAQRINARCLNAGTTGFGTAHELRILRRLLQRPDLHVVDAVVFQTCPYNDLRDNWEDGAFAVADGQLIEWDPPRIPLEIRVRDALLNNRIARSSRTLTLLANAWLGGPEVDQKSNVSTFELERALLREVRATTEQHHIPLVLVVAATSWELDQIPSQPYDERGRLDFFGSLAKELQVPWLDTRTIARQSEDYIANDGHLSAAGNVLIGQALAAELAPLLQTAPLQQDALPAAHRADGE
jgi:lysophospholipase L1-like esterase